MDYDISDRKKTIMIIYAGKRISKLSAFRDEIEKIWKEKGTAPNEKTIDGYKKLERMILAQMETECENVTNIQKG